MRVCPHCNQQVHARGYDAHMRLKHNKRGFLCSIDDGRLVKHTLYVCDHCGAIVIAGNDPKLQAIFDQLEWIPE